MIKIGALRAWMKNKIEKVYYRETEMEYEKGYNQAMQDVAEYFDFPLDDKLWEKWQP